ncbi:MAG: shikimate kinase [Chloroflexota bacterium]
MLLSFADRNLILTGYTGPNQPPIGQQIAERLKMRYVNVELHIEMREGMASEAVRTRYGDARLKTVESEVMQDVLLNRSSVIRVSGQTLLRSDYAKRLGETGPIICLVASLGAVLQRLHLSLGRNYHNPHERALAIGYLKREWAVRKLDGIHEIDTTYLSEADVMNTLIGIWQQSLISN